MGQAPSHSGSGTWRKRHRAMRQGCQLSRPGFQFWSRPSLCSHRPVSPCGDLGSSSLDWGQLGCQGAVAPTSCKAQGLWAEVPGRERSCCSTPKHLGQHTHPRDTPRDRALLSRVPSVASQLRAKPLRLRTKSQKPFTQCSLHRHPTSPFTGWRGIWYM